MSLIVPLVFVVYEVFVRVGIHIDLTRQYLVFTLELLCLTTLLLKKIILVYFSEGVRTHHPQHQIGTRLVVFSGWP
jgi:hypothetical protein